MSKLLSLKTILRLDSFKCIQNISKQRISYLLTKLNDRKVIGVKGNDSYDYIQGLVTNDLKHLCPTRECIHSFVLNTSGRVITDVFIYKYELDLNETKHLLIEIDSQLLQSMHKFLKSYRIRRKVDIDIRNEFEVWTLFPSVHQIDELLSLNYPNFESLNTEDLVVVPDPRLKEIGFRLLVRKLDNNDENETKDKIKTFLNRLSIECNETNVENYHKFRYRLGVGEGVKDFPIETCFPLECNGDLLNGISFLKGCYVGQELTARIYHTGVIRKRLMPIEVTDGKEVIESLSVQNVRTIDGKNVGKFRSNSGAYGLALLRIEDCLKADKLVLNDSELSIKCHKPFWWPKESIKESLPCGRADH